MRVALSFPGCHRRGGVERVLVECANYLTQHGHETHVFASDWDRSVLHEDVIRHEVPSGRRSPLVRLLSYSRNSGRAISDQSPSPDVNAGFGVLSVPGAVVWAQSVHAAWLEISQRQRTWKGRLLQRCNPIHPVLLSMERRYFRGRRYGKVIALSEQVQHDLMRIYAVPEKDIVILPNGYAPLEFNTTRTSTLRQEMRTKLGYGAADRVVVFVANELERKGFWPLVQAISRMANPQLRLLVVGNVNSKAYSGALHRLALTEQVQFVGSASDVAVYYAAADVFALPTQYEAWGLVIVEALACGLPVLTSRLAGAAIAVHEGETGELLDCPHDVNEIVVKLTAVLDRSATQNRVSPAEIEQTVGRYKWSNVLERYEAVLRDCCE